MGGLMRRANAGERFVRYFRTADPNMRRTVSERFRAVADEYVSFFRKMKEPNSH